MASSKSMQATAKAASRLPHEELVDLYLQAKDAERQRTQELLKAKEEIKLLTTKNQRLERAADGAVDGHQRGALNSKLEEAQLRIDKLEKDKEKLRSALKVAQQSAKPEKKTARYANVQSSLRAGGATRRGKESGFRSEAPSPGVIADLEAAVEQTRQESDGLRRQIADMDQELHRVHEQHQATEQKFSALVEQYKIKHAAHQEATRTNEQLMLQLEQKGTNENVMLLKMRREISEKEKLATQLQTKLDIQTEALQNLQSTSQANEQALHEKRLEAATLTAKIRDIEVNHRSTSVLLNSPDEYVARIEQLEAENAVLQQAQQDIAKAAMSGEREKHHARQREILNERIKQLQDQARDLMAKNSRLHQELCDEQGQSAKTDDETRELRRQLLTKQAELERQNEKLSFFISESGQSIEEAEEALAMIRARKDKQNSAPQGLLDEKERTNPKRELQELQVTHAETVHELEKTRALLAHQDSIAQQQQLRAERWVQKAAELEREFGIHRQEFDDALTKKTNRIASLEKQIRDIAYGTHQYAVAPTDGLGAEPEHLGHVELARGENLVEVCIVQAKITDQGRLAFGDVTPTSFLTYDFFEHESEVTPTVQGMVPRFNKVSQYIVKTNDQFIEYLHRGFITLEFYRTVGTSYELVASGQMSLRAIITEAPLGANRKQAAVIQLRSVKNPEAIAVEVTYWIRIRLPLDHAIRAHRESRKAVDYINAGEAGVDGADAGPAEPKPGENTLSITVVSCSGISSARPNQQPSAYVGYHFPGYEDVHTPIIQTSNDPYFEFTEMYPVHMNAELDECLRMEVIEFMVVDDDDEDLQAYLGAAQVPLSPLLDGSPIEGNFQLISDQGTVAGVVSLRIRWHHPYIRSGAHDSPTPRPRQPAALPSTRSEPTQPSPAPESPYEMEAPIAAQALRSGPPPTEVSQPEPPTEQSDAADTWAETSEFPTAPAIQVEDAPFDDVDEGDAVQKGAPEGLRAGPPSEGPEGDDGNSTYSASLMERSGDTVGTSRSAESDSRRRELAPDGHIVIEAVRFLETAPDSILRMRSQLFVLFHATWLGFKFFETKDKANDELGKCETNVASYVPDDPHAWIPFNHAVTLAFDGSEDPPGGDNDMFVVRGKKMPKSLKSMAREILKNQRTFLEFEVVHEPDYDVESAVPTPIAFVHVDLVESIWKKQRDLSSFDVPLFDYDAWKSQGEQAGTGKAVQIGEIRLTIKMLDAMHFRLDTGQ